MNAQKESNQIQEQLESEAGGIPNSPEYQNLIAQFGNAMLRIGQLEAQLNTSHPPSAMSQANGSIRESDGLTNLASQVDQLTERIEAIEKRLDNSESSTAESGGLEVSQVRMQITSLAGQLAQTQEELEKFQGTRIRRRSSRQHNRPHSKLAFWKKSQRR